MLKGDKNLKGGKMMMIRKTWKRGKIMIKMLKPGKSKMKMIRKC